MFSDYIDDSGDFDDYECWAGGGRLPPPVLYLVNLFYYINSKHYQL